ncbi:hypothetical protein [Chitinophaga tropicalis]|uniref:Uncharacterized protein n=1 Tax=Chitinophaga tropicalis TaxID=2683588 RepID=A0A7K1UE32_9BACT|nr:hypothetical protein [Chitinophaga tropicalis]MVT12538.1 hypothetical protein [Chitinophaga tropicalis]
MTFINPVEILGLSHTPVNAIDSSVIRKAKKALLAEVELSDDGYFHYRGQALTTSDCERYIDELEEKDKLEFYHFIAGNEKLNNFLAGTDNSLFSAFRHESIYRLPEFISFISPYFAAAYDKALVQTYKQADPAAFREIISTPPLVTEADIDRAFKSLRGVVEEQIEEFMTLTQQSKDKQLPFGPAEAPEIVQNKVSIEKVNAFPAYLHVLRTRLLREMREFTVYMFNNYDCLAIAIRLVNWMTEFNMEEAARQKLEEDLQALNKMMAQQVDQEKYGPVIEEYELLLNGIRSQIAAINTHAISLATLRNWVESRVNIEAINQLPDDLRMIRNQIALALNDLAVAVWNKHTSKKDCWSYIEMAESIVAVQPDTQRIIVNTKSKLEELMQGSSENSSVGPWVIGIIIAIFIFAFLSSRTRHSSSSYDYYQPTYQPPKASEDSKITIGSLSEIGNTSGSYPAIVTVSNMSREDVLLFLSPTDTSRRPYRQYCPAGSDYNKGLAVDAGTYVIQIVTGNKTNLKLMENSKQKKLPPSLKVKTLDELYSFGSPSEREITWAMIKLTRGSGVEIKAKIETHSIHTK